MSMIFLCIWIGTDLGLDMFHEFLHSINMRIQFTIDITVSNLIKYTRKHETIL